jgi:tetratricopeptide (TPR) repeat protein
LLSNPDYWNSFVLMALINMFWHGDLAAAQDAMRQSPAGVDPQGQVTFVRFEVAMWSRDFTEALKIVDGAPPWISSDPVHRRVPSVLLRAEALEAAGKSDEAHNAYAEAIHLLEAEVNVHSESPGLHGFLGRAYAGAGRKMEATRESRRAVDLQPVSSDAFDGPFYLEQLAEIQARVGNVDEALSLIRQVVDMPAGLALSPAALKLDPVWDPIRNDPRFQKLANARP